MPKPATVDKDQIPMPIHLPCACGCGRSIEQPTTRGSGRPRRYAEEGCRQVALRTRRDEEARRAQLAAEERRRVERAAEAARAEAEIEEAQDVLVNHRGVAEFVLVWRRVLGSSWQKLNARQILAIRDAFDGNEMNLLRACYDPAEWDRPENAGVRLRCAEWVQGAPRNVEAVRPWTDEEIDEDEEELEDEDS